MDKIYTAAALTIAAASGKDVHDGLSGFRPGSRDSPQCVEKIKGLHLIAVASPLEEGLEKTIWHSRCWTYQVNSKNRREFGVTQSD